MGLPKMLSLKQAAEESGLSYGFLRNLCIEGGVRCIRSGKKWYINEDSLTSFLNGSLKVNENG